MMTPLAKKWNLKKTILRRKAKSNNNKDNHKQGNQQCKPAIIKSVSFQEEPQIYNVEAMSCLSKKEILGTWFTTDELIAMKKEAKSIARKINSTCPTSQSNNKTTTTTITTTSKNNNNNMIFYTRGLECRIHNVAKHKAQKENAINVVLEEQRHQRSLNVQDNEKLALVYHQATFECQERAYKVGCNDMLASKDDDNHNDVVFAFENDSDDDLSSTAASSTDWSLTDRDGGDDCSIICSSSFGSTFATDQHKNSITGVAASFSSS